MEIREIIELATLGVTAISLLVSIIVPAIKGQMRDFILEKMEEAEASGKSGKEKLEFVIEETKAKYKIAATVSSITKLVEKTIEITKKINVK